MAQCEGAAIDAPVFHNVLESIGNTPLIEVGRIDTGPCQLFLKLENQNPGGSIKDRIGKLMIEAAERDGTLKPGGTIIEATAGNTGLGLALVASQKGFRLIIVVPDKMAQEKIFHLKALGAEVLLTRSDVGKGHPEYYQDMAERIARETGAFFVNQFANPANPLAHETTTAPEIWAQMDHDLDAVVCGVGSGGTIAGLSRYFAEVAPHVGMILADPEGSVLAHYVDTGTIQEEVGSWLVEGIGEDFLPPVCDLSRTQRAYTISDDESFHIAREVLDKEGILAGSSSGTLIAAALRYCRAQEAPKRVVTFVCDSGNKYLSKMFNDFWMIDQGFIEREQHGDLSDLISRRHAEHSTIFVPRGYPAHRLRPHEALRHLPATGHVRRGAHRRHRRRERHPARGDARRGALQGAGRNRHDLEDRDHPGRRAYRGPTADLPRRPRAHRARRRHLPRPDHPHRPAQLPEAEDEVRGACAALHRR